MNIIANLFITAGGCAARRMATDSKRRRPGRSGGSRLVLRLWLNAHAPQKLVSEERLRSNGAAALKGPRDVLNRSRSYVFNELYPELSGDGRGLAFSSRRF